MKNSILIWKNVMALHNTPDSSPAIQDLYKPVCKNCIYFTPNSWNGNNGKCGKFGKRDLINGNIDYEYVRSIRYDDAKCGLSGKFFTAISNNKWRKIKKKIAKTIWMRLIMLALVMLSFLLGKTDCVRINAYNMKMGQPTDIGILLF